MSHRMATFAMGSTSSTPVSGPHPQAKPGLGPEGLKSSIPTPGFVQAVAPSEGVGAGPTTRSRVLDLRSPRLSPSDETRRNPEQKKRPQTPTQQLVPATKKQRGNHNEPLPVTGGQEVPRPQRRNDDGKNQDGEGQKNLTSPPRIISDLVEEPRRQRRGDDGKHQVGEGQKNSTRPPVIIPDVVDWNQVIPSNVVQQIARGLKTESRALALALRNAKKEEAEAAKILKAKSASRVELHAKFLSCNDELEKIKGDIERREKEIWCKEQILHLLGQLDSPDKNDEEDKQRLSEILPKLREEKKKVVEAMGLKDDDLSNAKTRCDQATKELEPYQKAKEEKKKAMDIIKRPMDDLEYVIKGLEHPDGISHIIKAYLGTRASRR